ncbi:unnamed protein product [Victoria cruziana]
MFCLQMKRPKKKYLKSKHEGQNSCLGRTRVVDDVYCRRIIVLKLANMHQMEHLSATSSDTFGSTGS